jgi:hypothetical protein
MHLLRTVLLSFGIAMSGATCIIAQSIVVREISCTSAGTLNAYKCSPETAIATYIDGQKYEFKADLANTGAATVNFGPATAPIVKAVGAVTTPLVANDILAGAWVEVVYNQSNGNMQMVSLLGNSGGGTAGAYTSVSFSATPTFTAGSNTVDAWTITLTGNVTSSTLASAATGERLGFKICQDATGGRTFVWPTGFGAAGTISPIASVCTKQEFYWDGSNAVPLAGATADGGPSFISAEQAAPATPAASTVYCWPDSTDHAGWECKANNSANAFKMVLGGVDLNPVTGQLSISTTGCSGPQNVTAISARGVGTCGSTPVTQNSQSGAYTTVLSDAEKQIYHPSADTTARMWTIDSNANVAYPVGTAITFVNDCSAGLITIAITSDTLVLAGAGTIGSRTLAACGIATALKMTSTRWMINGNGIT